MAIIYETENFILESHERPEIDRLEGGHIKISPKVPINDRTELTPKQAIEFMRFTIISGEAMVLGMKRSGVDISRINYQENGNWNPVFHLHLYGRVKNAKVQKYGEPILNGHREEYKSLSEEDIRNIKMEIEKLIKEEKFSDKVWNILN